MVRSRTRRRTDTGDADEELDVYAYAFLAGGTLRVAESAVIALTERGMLSLGAARLRVVGDERPGHPVERAVITACPRSKPLPQVVEAVRNSPEVAELATRLLALGLIRDWRRRPTRAGRRRLAAARAEDGLLPAYVLDGPAALLDPGPAQYGPSGVQDLPAGLNRTLMRMGRALDHDYPYYGSDSAGFDGGSSGGGGGFSCGSGGSESSGG
ncbi:TIGR04222 domain-containing membrane protein [Streptomyces laurentii]|uniref:TIGR04222 domain-containing membrane protein n=1 Tax=Streptomyces laurentii TaxID=39478 RepID=UPI0036943C80